MEVRDPAAADGSSYAAKFVRDATLQKSLTDERDALLRLKEAGVGGVPVVFEGHQGGFLVDKRAEGGPAHYDQISVNGLLLSPVGTPVHRWLKGVEESERPERLRAVFVALTQTIEAAHGAEICHGDAHRANIIVVETAGVPRPFLIDWGLTCADEAWYTAAKRCEVPGCVSQDGARKCKCAAKQFDMLCLGLAYVTLAKGCNGTTPWPHGRRVLPREEVARAVWLTDNVLNDGSMWKGLLPLQQCLEDDCRPWVPKPKGAAAAPPPPGTGKSEDECDSPPCISKGAVAVAPPAKGGVATPARRSKPKSAAPPPKPETDSDSAAPPPEQKAASLKRGLGAGGRDSKKTSTPRLPKGAAPAPKMKSDSEEEEEEEGGRKKRARGRKAQKKK